MDDNRLYVNASILLKANHNVGIQQVEDDRLYVAVGEHLHLLEGIGSTPYVPIFFNEELEYLQERRTVAMSQNIPAAIEREFQQGHITKKTASFTIGLAHIRALCA